MFLKLAKSVVMGGLFVVFLPLIGYFLVMYGIFEKCQEWSKSLATTVTGPSPAVGAAYLTGAEPKAHEGPATVDTRLDTLAKEIEAKRKS